MLWLLAREDVNPLEIHLLEHQTEAPSLPQDRLAEDEKIPDPSNSHPSDSDSDLDLSDPETFQEPALPPPSVLSELYQQPSTITLFPSQPGGSSLCAAWTPKETGHSKIDCWGSPPFAFCHLQNVFYINRTFICFGAGAARDVT